MLKRILPFIVIVGFTALFSYALGHNSRKYFNLPMLWLLMALSLVIQIFAFIPAAIFNTERFYDLVGALTSLSLTSLALFSNEKADLHEYLSALLIVVWSMRLGVFLFSRIIKKGQDSRFVQIKLNKVRFFYAWLLQGLWVIITISPLLVILAKQKVGTQSQKINLLQIIGLLVWILGFAIQNISDCQKSNFNNNPSNKGKFISIGLWSISRHPNYFGEITLWFGATIFAIPSLEGGEILAAISPIFVYLLISRISGVPLLQKSADKRWGDVKQYMEYKSVTPVLFPFKMGKKQNKKQS